MRTWNMKRPSRALSSLTGLLEPESSSVSSTDLLGSSVSAWFCEKKLGTTCIAATESPA